ncbi:protein INCA1 isoform 1-T1 [Megaptera novaeangliae]
METRNCNAVVANGAGNEVALLVDGGVMDRERAPMRRLSPAAQPSPVMQAQEDGDNLIPFAKCSRVVSRSPPPSLPSRSLRLTPQRYGDTFWENLSQRPSPTWMEEQYIPPLLRATGCSQPGLYPPEGLPPPEVLCRRKRRRPHLAGMQQGSGSIPARVRAVTYHLEDLRRRQRIINELKKAQWGSSRAASEPLVLDDDGCGLPNTTEHPGLEEERANSPREEDHFLAPGRAQVRLSRNLVGWWRVMWMPRLAWRDSGSQEARWIAGFERNKNKVDESQRLGSAWVWGLGNLERDPFFDSSFFFLQFLILTAALVSLESPGPGGVLSLRAAELSGLLQHCHNQ